MKKLLILINLILVIICSVTAKEIHVSKNGNDSNSGSSTAPLLTINAAAKVAYPGDTVIVHAGTYREWINPVRGGESDSKRIVYMAAVGEKVHIKGSEEVTGWEKVRNGVWRITISNDIFIGHNPFRTKIEGDWYFGADDLDTANPSIFHTGDLFVDGVSFFEKNTLEEIMNPAPHKWAIHKEKAKYVWCCESNEKETTIWANFHEIKPNKALTEVSVRPTCFYPTKKQINYITIKGFEFSQAATQWAAPTAEQIGMIATHWNKGWIIENNIVHDSKCVGITIGKERSSGHNVWSKDKSYSGSVHYIETIFKVLRLGWSRENIGSHMVRNNTIYNCEMAGICGSMGCAFSTIEKNHIYNIWIKRQFWGGEIAGIKFHGAIDCIIRNNRVNNSCRGLWLDWMAQGTRVSCNLFYNNSFEDLWMEANHGPCLIDNNLFLSARSIKNQSLGTAFVHNLIAGGIVLHIRSGESVRFTPYLLPHSTQVAGLDKLLGGDDRYYNNMILGQGSVTGDNYKKFSTVEVYKKKERSYKYGLAGFDKALLPIFTGGNLYYNGAVPHPNEKTNEAALSFNPTLFIKEKGNKVWLQISMDKTYLSKKVELIDTEKLGQAKRPKQGYTNPDGSPLIVDKDYLGKPRTKTNNKAGAFNALKKGENAIRVW